MLKNVGGECFLTDDMGASWLNTGRMIEIRRYEDKDIRFINISVELLSGEGSYSPEDFCGVSGYEEILLVINDPEECKY